jgi:ABC-type lipoprotein export system ATPase subunit
MEREVNSVYNICAWVKSLPTLSSINIHDSLLQKQRTKNQQLKQFDVGTLRGNALADFRRQKIGFVFQLFNLVPSLNALENVMLPLLPYRRGLDFNLQARAQELLAGMGLGDRLDHLPGQLSGGEQQRVAIARALINQPHLILADEPTGNLDSKRGQEILSLLHQLNQERGLTMVLVTHDTAVVVLMLFGGPFLAPVQA